MAPALTTYMTTSRFFQIACCVVIISSNGWLINFIAKRKLGLGPNMIALEIMALLILTYTSIAILVLHMCQRSTCKPWLITFMLWDMIFIGICVAMISVYSFAGVPNNCGGMTRSNWNPGDAPNNPAPGFTTVRFGPGTFGNYGELDIYCDIPQTGYAMCIILLFTYVLTLILATTRMLSFHYTCNSLVSKLVSEAEEKTKKRISDTSSITTTNSSLHHTPSDTRSSNDHPPSTSPAPVVPVMTCIHGQYPFGSHPSNNQNNVDIEAEAADPRISDGSTGTGGIVGGPPPYMPSPVAGRNEAETAGSGNENGNGTGSTIPGYGKDQEFPGLES